MRDGPVAQVGHFSGREKEEEEGHKVEQLTKEMPVHVGCGNVHRQGARFLHIGMSPPAVVHINSKYAMRIQRPPFFLTHTATAESLLLNKEQGTRKLWYILFRARGIWACPALLIAAAVSLS